ncbi:MAG: BTAD domain-containing putative transcriptional regulator [Gemmatimonadota bacterium]
MTRGEDVRLDTSRIVTDVERFERALESGNVEAAAELYCGPFLDGIHLGENEEFERWVAAERVRLEDLYSQSLERAALAAQDRGDWKSAAQWWRRSAVQEPYSSRTVLGLMEALARSGAVGEALREARAHEVRLRDELGLPPDLEVQSRASELRGSAGKAGQDLRLRISTVPSGSPSPDEGRALDPERVSRWWTGKVVIGLVVMAVAVLVVRDFTSSQTSSDPTLDPGRVAVVPFRVSGSSETSRYLGEGMIDLLAAKLTGEGGLRAVDPRVIMRTWNHEVSRTGKEAPETAFRVAREHGAGRVVWGDVVDIGDRIVLNARLLAVPGGGTVALSSVEGSADSLISLVDRLTADLLVGHASGKIGGLGERTTRSLPALRAYLDGRSRYRQGRYEAAIEAYRKALDQDSTFALAAIGLAEVARQRVQSRTTLDDLDRGLRLAWAGRDRLTEGNLLYLKALGAPEGPWRTGSEDLLIRWERAAETLEDRAEAWYELGRSLARTGPAIGISTWKERARTSLRRAIELDPSFQAPIIALIVLEAREGHRDEVTRLLALSEENGPTGDETGFVKWVAAITLADTARLLALRRDFDSMPTKSLERIVGYAQLQGAGLDDSDRAADILWARARSGTLSDERLQRLGTLYMLENHAHNCGRPLRARRFLEEATRLYVDGDRRLDQLIVLEATYSDADTTGLGAALDRLDRGALAPPVQREMEPIMRDYERCLVAAWRVRQNASSGREELKLPEKLRDSPHARLRSCGLALESWLGLRGWLDPKTVLPRVEAASRRGENLYAPFIVHHTVARLHESQGDLQAALNAARRRSPTYLEGTWGLAPSLRLEARLATMTGDTVGAIRAWRHYVALRSDPEPALAPDLARAKAELSRLTD